MLELINSDQLRLIASLVTANDSCTSRHRQTPFSVNGHLLAFGLFGHRQLPNGLVYIFYNCSSEYIDKSLSFTFLKQVAHVQ